MRVERLFTDVFGGDHKDYVEEAAASTEQHQPPVIELRRHLIEQIRLFKATPDDDSLLVLTIDWYFYIILINI